MKKKMLQFRIQDLMCVMCWVVGAGFGVDPALRIDVLRDFAPADQDEGLSQVQGLHDESRAFLFQGIHFSFSFSLQLTLFHCVLW